MHNRPQRPEILAPAGDLEAMRVALAAGADAVYFGLDEGFNARARAQNFTLANLPDVVAMVHRAGARAYVTMNTLVFDVEVDAAERLIRACAHAGVDALIVQDPAVALIAREICPTLEIHASTQMTISSAEGVRFAQSLGVTRVVVPRELSVKEIARLKADTDVELEVFIHGALCMSWSGQCLTSEAWGGRSANRGQCAQSCRMPYDLIVDGEHRPLDDLRYLLSPADLAGVRAVPALAELGVATLKIEGRLKGPAYVHSTVSGLRRWLDAVDEGRVDDDDVERMVAEDLATMMVAYSRGFSDGFLGGADHQNLVEGRFPKHRGAYLGRVTEVRGQRVTVGHEDRPTRSAVGSVLSPLHPLGGDPDAGTGARVAAIVPRAGMGVVFDAGQPEAPQEEGGPIFGVESPSDAVSVLLFGRPGPDLRRVTVGDRVWINSDPQTLREAQRAGQVDPSGRVPLGMRVVGRAGEPLQVEATIEAGAAKATHVTVAGSTPLASADGPGIDEEILRSKLGKLGGTPFHLTSLDVAELDPGLHLPVSRINALRRELVDALLPRVERGAARAVEASPVAARVLEEVREAAQLALGERPVSDVGGTSPQLIPLVRTDAQLDAVIELGLDEVELDWMELVGLSRAFARARAAGLRVHVATVRVQKPGEEGIDHRLARLKPDGVLVRHWGGMMHFAERSGDARPSVHGDFSLNVTNAITANALLARGLDSLTAAHDLDQRQLFELLSGVDASRVTVVVHHHISTFHTEHCVYAHTLSEGRDFRTCGRPCEEHRVALRDHKGLEHPVVVDVGCRNTVFNAKAQSAARLVPSLLDVGVRRFRVELVWEDRDTAHRVLVAYRDLLRGERDASEVISELEAVEQFGVTSGTMQVLRFSDARSSTTRA